MTARDNLSFNIICTSDDIRAGLAARKFKNIPTSPNGIRSMVMSFGKNVRDILIAELSKLKDEGCRQRCSLTFDKWTSNKNRRYLNINVHFETECRNLGLVRVNGSLPAEECVDLVKKKLAEYNLDIDDDVVCITTDGARVMVKVGKLVDAEQQLCYAHAIHLAVTDILYKTPKPIETDEETESEAESSREDEDEDEVLEKDGDVDGFAIEKESLHSCEITHENLLHLVKKIRKTVCCLDGHQPKMRNIYKNM